MNSKYKVSLKLSFNVNELVVFRYAQSRLSSILVLLHGG